MPGKRVTELDTLPSFTDASLLPVHNGAGLKKGTLTQLLNYLGNKFSNPNLLINPDFAVNQRGEDTYEIQNSAKYTVDRWKLWNAKVSKIDNGIKLENNFASIGTLQQKLEKAYSDIVTMSCYVESVTGTVTMKATGADETVTLKQGLNYVTTSNCNDVTFTINPGASAIINWAKLEKGNISTQFVKPDLTEESIKCEKFYKIVPLLLGEYLTIGAGSAYKEVTLRNDLHTMPTCKASKNEISYIMLNSASPSDITKKIYSVVVEAIYRGSIVLKINAPFEEKNWSTGLTFVGDKPTLIYLDAEIY